MLQYAPWPEDPFIIIFNQAFSIAPLEMPPAAAKYIARLSMKDIALLLFAAWTFCLKEWTTSTSGQTVKTADF